MSDKIKSHHLERKAILYVRQSSSYQVTHNEESRRLQYAMRNRLEELGWQEIEVIDEDLGRSAAGIVARSGFERMVADVCLGKVGAVVAREVSRFARNSLSTRTLRLAAERGDIPGQHPLAVGPWVFTQSDLESQSARDMVAHARQRGGRDPAVPLPSQQLLGFSGT